MKKTRISLRGLSSILSEKELRNVIGGSSVVDDDCGYACTSDSDCVRACKKCTVTSGWGGQKACWNQ